LVKKWKRLIILIFVLLITAGIVLYSPRFLLYATDYKKVDAIVILLGPDFKARQKEANELIDKGMTDYLIIPAYHKAYRINSEDKGKYLLNYLKSPGFNDKKAVSYPDFYEDTHIEIIEAQKVMSFFGLKSAIFVSSPYHMRRVNSIVSKIFDVHHDFYFVPTKYEKAPADFWELSSSDWKKVRREYGKIIWFYIYFTCSKYINFS
jgi:hypothetical protein